MAEIKFVREEGKMVPGDDDPDRCEVCRFGTFRKRDKNYTGVCKILPGVQNMIKRSGLCNLFQR